MKVLGLGLGWERENSIKQDWSFVEVNDEYMEVITLLSLLLYILEPP